jgi:hypothetical protein
MDIQSPQVRFPWVQSAAAPHPNRDSIAPSGRKVTSGYIPTSFSSTGMNLEPMPVLQITKKFGNWNTTSLPFTVPWEEI